MQDYAARCCDLANALHCDLSHERSAERLVRVHRSGHTAGALDDINELSEVRRLHTDPRVGVHVRKLRDGALLNESTLTDHHEVGRHQCHLRQQVATHEHRSTFGSEPFQNVADPTYTFGVETVCRLVEDDRVRIAEQDAGEAETLAHAERVALHAAVGGFGQADGVEHSIDAAALDAVRHGHPTEVIPPGPTWVDVAGIEERADLVQRLVELAESTAAETSLTALGLVEAEHAAHRRALTGTVRTEKPGDTSRMHIEAQVVHRRDAAELLGDVSDLDHVIDRRSTILCERGIASHSSQHLSY